MLTLEPPVLDSVNDCVWLLFTVTVPRFKLLGVTARIPEVTPLPLNDTFTVGLEALEMIDNVEANVPAVDGANVTVRFALAPGDRVYGKVMPPVLKPVPVTLTEEMLRVDPPLLESVSVCVWLLPTGTLPRFTLEGAIK